MGELIKQKREANANSITKIKGDEAAKVIASSTNMQAPEIVYESEEAEGLGVKKGEVVAVAPDDNGLASTFILMCISNLTLYNS